MAKFQTGNPGRTRGSKNKKTLILERVYQRCLERGFHPADFIIAALSEKGLSVQQKIDTAFKLLGYLEGVQPESKPHVPATPADSVEHIRETMRKLEELSQPIEPPESK